MMGASYLSCLSSRRIIVINTTAVYVTAVVKIEAALRTAIVVVAVTRKRKIAAVTDAASQ